MQLVKRHLQSLLRRLLKPPFLFLLQRVAVFRTRTFVPLDKNEKLIIIIIGGEKNG